MKLKNKVALIRPRSSRPLKNGSYGRLRPRRLGKKADAAEN